MTDIDSSSVATESKKSENENPTVVEQSEALTSSISDPPASLSDDQIDDTPTQTPEKHKDMSSERLAADNCPCPCKDCGGGPSAASEIGCWHNLWLLGHTQRRDYVKSPSPSKNAEETGENRDEDEEQFATIPEPLSTGEVFKQGWLRKQGGGTSGVFARRNWRNRWFVLVGTTLKYYKDETHFLAAAQNKALGWLTLDGSCSVVEKPNKRGVESFSLVTLNRTLHLQECAEYSGSLASWRDILTSIIAKEKTDVLMY